MILLVCGSRHLRDGAFVFDQLDRIHASRNITLLVEGGQRTIDFGKTVGGTDYWAFVWAVARCVGAVSEAAAWHDLSHPDALIKTNPNGIKYDARAGGRRNQKMLDQYVPDIVVGISTGGPGTKDMLRRARREQKRRPALDVVEIAYG